MSSNPLQQYFRRPVIYISLPSQGKYYSNDVVDIPPNNELPVYPMTALDEITSRTPDALYNGTAMADIIKSCIPNIKDPWKINSIDLETITIAIKIATGGEELEIESKCPSCQEEAKYGINLIGILRDQHYVDYEELLNVGELKIKFRPLIYKEINQINLSQYEIRKMLVFLEDYESNPEQVKQINDNLIKMNDLIVDMLALTIDKIITPETVVTDKAYISEYLKNCDKKTNNLIRTHSMNMKEKNSMKPINIKCIHCEHQYNQSLTLNITDFFE